MAKKLFKVMWKREVWNAIKMWWWVLVRKEFDFCHCGRLWRVQTCNGMDEVLCRYCTGRGHA